MESRRGTVSKIRFSTEVTGSGGDNGSVSTSHIASFELDRRPVQLRAARPVILEGGDTVVVAGKTKGGLFQADACFNETRGIFDHSPWVLHVAGGSIFLFIGSSGIVTLLVLALQLHNPILLIYCAFPLIFASAGGWLLSTGVRISRACELVRRPA
jgi:hypothetical protein